VVLHEAPGRLGAACRLFVFAARDRVGLLEPQVSDEARLHRHVVGRLGGLLREREGVVVDLDLGEQVPQLDGLVVGSLARRRRPAWAEGVMVLPLAGLPQRRRAGRAQLRVRPVRHDRLELLGPARRGALKEQGQHAPLGRLAGQAKLALAQDGWGRHGCLTRSGAQPERILRAPPSCAAPCQTAKATDVRLPGRSPAGRGRVIMTAHPSFPC